MKVNSVQILLVDVTFHLLHIKNVVPNVLIKMKSRIYAAPAVKGLGLERILHHTVIKIWLTEENEGTAWAT